MLLEESERSAPQYYTDNFNPGSLAILPLQDSMIRIHFPQDFNNIKLFPRSIPLNLPYSSSAGIPRYVKS
jgi:hypothetical protein